MGIPVMILGESGSGKSTSMRSFPCDEAAVINVARKPLPFRGKLPVLNTDSYAKITASLSRGAANCYIIDDCQYLLANEFMRRASENGYQKFMDIGRDFWLLVQSVIDLPEDTIVYFLGHTERDADGREKFKTIGKMLDEKITVEGMFTVVLACQIVEGRHIFRTRSTGHDTVKAPMGMFEEEIIDNDLCAVDDAIRSYWGLNPRKKLNKEGN